MVKLLLFFLKIFCFFIEKKYKYFNLMINLHHYAHVKIDMKKLKNIKIEN